MKYPSYMNLSDADWAAKKEQSLKMLSCCTLCGHRCKINRLKGEKGFCRQGSKLKVASIIVHTGEEPCLAGEGDNFRGTGNIFFSGCTARCTFCQNYPISQLGVGNEIASIDLALEMIKLQNRKVHHIGLVTPTPHIPLFIDSLYLAIDKGLNLPLIINTNAYMTMECLALLDGLIDIYLPDFKYSSNKVSKEISKMPGYRNIAIKAIKEMYRQTGRLKLKNKIAYRGVLIRHLVLPSNFSQSENVLRIITKKIDRKAAISLMNQYFPAYNAVKHPLLKRRLSPKSYLRAQKTMNSLHSLWGWKQK
ncbi:MAG: radical SAM protein [Candidatus Coatesbacteria bacterium]|nr:radical SAM protein [Candidatus Coatesbacteria bacterium]